MRQRQSLFLCLPVASPGERTIFDRTPESYVSFSESLLALPPPQVPTWSVTGHPEEILGLSPSLFSSPSRLLPEQILEDDTMFLTQGEPPGPGHTLNPFTSHGDHVLRPAQAMPGTSQAGARARFQEPESEGVEGLQGSWPVRGLGVGDPKAESPGGRVQLAGRAG